MREDMDTIKIVTPRTLKRRFKTLCVQLDTTMSDVATELINQWLDENEDLTRGERTTLK